MRNTAAEASWYNHPVIGYVPLGEDGKPYRAARSGYGFQTQAQKGYHPPRIYQTMAKAQAQSPCKTATEVRMFQQITVDHKGPPDYNYGL